MLVAFREGVNFRGLLPALVETPHLQSIFGCDDTLSFCHPEATLPLALILSAEKGKWKGQRKPKSLS